MIGNAALKLFRTGFVVLVNLAALGSLVYFSGCCWKTPEDKSYRLEVTQKHLLPYTNNEVINFENEQGEQFPVTVNKHYQIIKLAMTDYDCMECCAYNETLELEIVELNPAGLEKIFPVLVAAPLKSTPYRFKDGSYELRVITAESLEYLQSGAGSPLQTEKALSFDDSRELICIHNEPFRFCHQILQLKDVMYENVAEVKLTKIHQSGFSFLQCFFNNTGLLGIRQIIYDNDLPVDTLNYFRVD